MKTLSAFDLLRFSVEIVALNPEGTDFDEKKLRNPYQIYRYKQALALLKAFGILDDFPGFISGSFVAGSTKERYSESLQEIRKTLKQYPPKVVSKRKLGLIFRLALEYLVAISRVQRYWKNFVIADPALLYPQVACKGLNTGIDSNTSELKRILCLIIDPMKQNIAIQDLIAKYGYPEMEIEETDGF